MLSFSAAGIVWSAEFVVAGWGLPSETGKELDGGLLDEGVFGVVGHFCLVWLRLGRVCKG